MTPEENYKKLFKPLRLSMYDFKESSVRKELETLVDSNAIIPIIAKIDSIVNDMENASIDLMDILVNNKK